MSRHSLLSRIAIAAARAGGLYGAHAMRAQDGPSLVDQNLRLTVFAAGLIEPTSLSVIGANDLLVLEKRTGQVKRVSRSGPPLPVLDRAVNFASRRRLLGIALHPDFATVPHVFLFWTESTTG